MGLYCSCQWTSEYFLHYSNTAAKVLVAHLDSRCCSILADLVMNLPPSNGFTTTVATINRCKLFLQFFRWLRHFLSRSLCIMASRRSLLLMSGPHQSEMVPMRLPAITTAPTKFTQNLLKHFSTGLTPFY